MTETPVFTQECNSPLVCRRSKISVDLSYWYQIQSLHGAVQQARIKQNHDRGKNTWMVFVSFYFILLSCQGRVKRKFSTKLLICI
jgi:hypothetical protein